MNSQYAVVASIGVGNETAGWVKPIGSNQQCFVPNEGNNSAILGIAKKGGLVSVILNETNSQVVAVSHVKGDVLDVCLQGEVKGEEVQVIVGKAPFRVLKVPNGCPGASIIFEDGLRRVNALLVEGQGVVCVWSRQ